MVPTTLQELQDRLAEARQLLLIAEERVRLAQRDRCALVEDVAAIERTIKMLEEKA